MRVPAAVFRAVLILAATAPSVASAQHVSKAVALAKRTPKEVSQYDFLVGEWELLVKPAAVGLMQKMHGVPNLRGTWKATRTADGLGIEDVLRIVDRSGNPVAVTRFVRTYDDAAKHWAITAADSVHGKVTKATAEWMRTEMVTIGDASDEDGKKFISRARISGPTPTSFKYMQDRSYDGGATWGEVVLTIYAQRTTSSTAK